MFETTVAGSLPKPLWLAEPEKLWPAWKLEGDALAAGKIDATILAVKLQEDAGIDIGSITGSGPHGRVVASDVAQAKSGGGTLRAPAAAPRRARRGWPSWRRTSAAIRK